jgi:hypothetical protein
MAIMFNICAVSQGWREIIGPDGSATIIAHPAWYVLHYALFYFASN